MANTDIIMHHDVAVPLLDDNRVPFGISWSCRKALLGASILTLLVASVYSSSQLWSIVRTPFLTTPASAIASTSSTILPSPIAITTLHSHSQINYKVPSGDMFQGSMAMHSAAQDMIPTRWPLPTLWGSMMLSLGALAFIAVRGVAKPSNDWMMCATVEEEENDPTVILVSNLPESATWKSLGQHFGRAGQVEFATIQTEPDENNKPVRRGVVQFSTWEAAAWAIQEMSKYPMAGNVLVVEPDMRPASERNKKRSLWARAQSDGTADGSLQDAAKAKEAQQLVEKWETLRAERKYEEADELRDFMQSKSIVVNPKNRTWFFGKVQPVPAEYDAVVVENIPKTATRESLKAHFTIAGDVESAVIFKDKETGKQGSRGLVRFKTHGAAKNAVGIMKQHPLEGATLVVKPDRYTPAIREVPYAPWRRDPRDRSANNSPEDIALSNKVESILVRRDSYRAAQMYDKADETQAELQQLEVVIDNKSRLWRRAFPSAGIISKAESRALYIQGIPQTATRDELIEHFSLAGKVEYVIIVTDRNTRLPTGAGTVVFSKPQEAQKAVVGLTHVPFNGINLRIEISTRPPPVPKSRATTATTK